MDNKSILLLHLIFQGILSSYIYLGVERYGNITKDEVLNPESKIYRFLNEKKEEEIFKIYPGDIISNQTNSSNYDKYKCEDGAYPIQNKLKEGYKFDLTIENNTIMDIAQITKVENKYNPPITNTPGLRTLKNFLLTAFQPVGTTLYVFGGAWDFQDIGSSYEARTIGISENWIKFFDDHDSNYTYKDTNHSKSYYPFEGFNEYYYAGLDCSGFVGWTLYNTIYKDSLKEKGYVMSAKLISKYLSTLNYGTWKHTVEGFTNFSQDYLLFAKELKVGDIISTDGHVMIVLGKCSDNSFIILHSTPSNSLNGQPGGGVQITAVNPNESGSKNCEAYNLCKEYMQKYFKKWCKKYEAYVIETSKVFNFINENTGIFHWDLQNGVINDPENYTMKNAKEILSDLFKQNNNNDGGNETNVLLIVFIILGSIVFIIIFVFIMKKIKRNKEGNYDQIEDGLMNKN